MQKNGFKLLQDLRTKDETFWRTQGEKNALNLFHKTSERVPAYRDFLKKEKIDSSKIKTILDFDHLPWIDKKNYISKYPLADLCLDGNLQNGAIISQSSGTTGQPFFWPRFKSHSWQTTEIHQAIFREFHSTNTKKTLFVVCFHLGAHIAGMITASAIKSILDSGMPGALITPGLNKKDILRAVEQLGYNFDQVMLIGYPPYIKDVIEEGKEMGLDWKKYNLRFLFAAESFPESWRSYLYNLTSVTDMKGAVTNIYGSADLGLMAHETPFTVGIRKSIPDHPNLAELFGGSVAHPPAIFQYNPASIYFETINNELICSSDAGIPLIRYNIHDLGSVVPLEKIKTVGFSPTWKLPLLSVLGRSNYSATIYGLNVYPEQVREIISNRSIMTEVSGKFFLKTSFSDTEDQRLEIHLELSHGTESTNYLVEKLTKETTELLRQINLEFDKLCESIGERAHPKLFVYKKGDERFRDLKMKHKHIVDN
jgi:phenylacetate-CoA ligase